jgi:hypothetical protein
VSKEWCRRRCRPTLVITRYYRFNNQLSLVLPSSRVTLWASQEFAFIILYVLHFSMAVDNEARLLSTSL